MGLVCASKRPPSSATASLGVWTYTRFPGLPFKRHLDRSSVQSHRPLRSGETSGIFVRASVVKLTSVQKRVILSGAESKDLLCAQIELIQARKSHQLNLLRDAQHRHPRHMNLLLP